MNGWDSKIIFEDLQNHPQFRDPKLTRASADQNFHRVDLLGPAKLLPDQWMQETCALGSTAECVKQLKVFKDLGVDELAFYGSNPVHVLKNDDRDAAEQAASFLIGDDWASGSDDEPR